MKIAGETRNQIEQQERELSWIAACEIKQEVVAVIVAVAVVAEEEEEEEGEEEAKEGEAELKSVVRIRLDLFVLNSILCRSLRFD